MATDGERIKSERRAGGPAWLRELGDLFAGLSRLVWPAIAVTVLVILWGPVRGLIEERAFTLRIGDAEISVQNTVNQQSDNMGDFVAQLSAFNDRLTEVEELTRGAQPRPSPSPEPVQSSGSGEEIPALTAQRPTAEPRREPGRLTTPRFLWVDDEPHNNAYEISLLHRNDFSVETATSTAEAMRQLARGRTYDAIITDMRREERGEEVLDAGLQLVRQLRKAKRTIPVFMYSPSSLVDENAPELSDAGVRIVRNSVELYSALKEVR